MNKQVNITVEKKSNWRTFAAGGPICCHLRKYQLLYRRAYPLCATANGIFELGVGDVQKAGRVLVQRLLDLDTKYIITIEFCIEIDEFWNRSHGMLVLACEANGGTLKPIRVVSHRQGCVAYACRI